VHGQEGSHGSGGGGLRGARVGASPGGDGRGNRSSPSELDLGLELRVRQVVQQVTCEGRGSRGECGSFFSPT